MSLRVALVPSSLVHPLVVRWHYARRMPCVQHAYAAYDEGEMVGAVTYGPPASPQVRRSLMGDDERWPLFELNRLVVMPNATANAASTLVGQSLAMLPAPCVVVSYADTGQGHTGYIYQATNFDYAGQAAAHDGEYLVNGSKVHPRTLAARGITDPVAWAAANGVEVVAPMPKHRYVRLIGSRTQRRHMRSAILWQLGVPYPKGERVAYETPESVPLQSALFI